MTGKWQRFSTAAFDGYRRGDQEITDNGSGYGSAKNSGRWALIIAGKWIANMDTLAEAKRRADDA